MQRVLVSASTLQNISPSVTSKELWSSGWSRTFENNLSAAYADLQRVSKSGRLSPPEVVLQVNGTGGSFAVELPTVNSSRGFPWWGFPTSVVPGARGVVLVGWCAAIS